MAQSIILENLRSLQNIENSNTYDAVQSIQDQMAWSRRHYKQQNTVWRKQ